MTQNLKIEVLTGDISIDGMVVTNLVTKEELSTAIVKKADLGTDGKIPTTQLPENILNTSTIVGEVKLQLETSIKDAVDESNAYAESYTDNALSSKADLTSGKVPLEQLPTIDQYPQFGTALSSLSTSILTATKQRTDQLEKSKADLGEDGKVLREQIPSYEKISGLPEQLELMSTQTAAVSGELDEHKLQMFDQVDALKENINSNSEFLMESMTERLENYADKDAVKRGIANRYDSSLTYNMGERVVLTNGDIVKSTIDGNTNDPNNVMTGWIKANAASQIFDVNGLSQQKWNNGVESIADLLSIPSPKNGDKYVVNHFDKLSGRLKGGGAFIYDSSRALENDGGVVLNGWVRQLENNVLNPFMFGAYGDFIPKAHEVIERKSGHDDSSAFQKMYNMNKYTVFTNISKLPPENKAEYTFEWANQMFYIEDTLPVRSYQFTDCKGGKIFFNPVGSKHLFTTPRQEMMNAYAVNIGWNTQTICYVTFKNGVILGNVTRTSTVHADTCFDLGNTYKCILDNMLIERFNCGVNLYPIDTSAWTNGERIGNFYENELRNVSIHECITGFINSANATHVSNLTIGGGYIVGKEYANKFNYLLMNGGAGFSCTGFNIAPSHRQDMTNALIYDGCLGSSYSGGYTEWFDTLFDLELQDRFGGFSFVGSHIFKEGDDIFAKFKDGAFSSFNYATETRTYRTDPKNNQFLNTTGIVIGGKTELIENFFTFVPQYDFKYGLYGVEASDGLTFDVKRYESVWAGFTSKYGLRVLNFSNAAKSLRLPISNKVYGAQIAVLYRNIRGFSASDIKLNVLEFNGTNKRITIGEDVFDYGNGWRLAVLKNINELNTSGVVQIDIAPNVQVEIEHVGAYTLDGYPFMPVYRDYLPKINSNYDRLYDNNNTSGGLLDVADLTAPMVRVVDGTVHSSSKGSRVCTVSGLVYPDISQSADATIVSGEDQILFETAYNEPISNSGVGCVLNLQQSGVRGDYRIVGRNYNALGYFNKNVKISKNLVTGSSIFVGHVLFYGAYNVREPLYADI